MLDGTTPDLFGRPGKAVQQILEKEPIADDTFHVVLAIKNARAVEGFHFDSFVSMPIASRSNRGAQAKAAP